MIDQISLGLLWRCDGSGLHHAIDAVQLVFPTLV